MVINFSNTCGMNWLVSAPNCIANSPIAQVALLHTDITSGFKFCPRIGKKFPTQIQDGLNRGCIVAIAYLTNVWLYLNKTCFSEITKQSKRALTHLRHRVL